MQNVFFKWAPSFSVHSEILDNQHMQLVEIMNELYTAFTKNDYKEKIGQILGNLNDYTRYHFTEEERLLQSMGHPISTKHKQEHQKFIDKLKEFNELYSRGRFAVTYEIMRFLRSWLTEHILGVDQKYAHVFKNQVKAR